MTAEQRRKPDLDHEEELSRAEKFEMRLKLIPKKLGERLEQDRQKVLEHIETLRTTDHYREAAIAEKYAEQLLQKLEAAAEEVLENMPKIGKAKKLKVLKGADQTPPAKKMEKARAVVRAEMYPFTTYDSLPKALKDDFEVVFTKIPKRSELGAHGFSTLEPMSAYFIRRDGGDKLTIDTPAGIVDVEGIAKNKNGSYTIFAGKYEFKTTQKDKRTPDDTPPPPPPPGAAPVGLRMGSTQKESAAPEKKPPTPPNKPPSPEGAVARPPMKAEIGFPTDIDEYEDAGSGEAATAKAYELRHKVDESILARITNKVKVFLSLKPNDKLKEVPGGSELSKAATPERLSDQKLGEVAAKYFSYNDIVPILEQKGDDYTIEIIKNKVKSLEAGTYVMEKNILKYSQALIELQSKHGGEEIDRRVTDIISRFAKLMEKSGLELNVFSKSRTWATWDIAKQFYLSEHPEESGPEYNLGNPIEDPKIIQQIIDRHFGWELAGQGPDGIKKILKLLENVKNEHTKKELTDLLNSKKNRAGKISSSDLEKLGRKFREVIIKL